jgi:membrane-bound inhibitor of C-type lysozyme
MSTRSVIVNAAIRIGVCRSGGRWATLVACALMTAACVPTGLPETVLPAQVRYACRDGAMLDVRREGNGQLATVTMSGKSVRLMRVDSAAQEKYSTDGNTLYLDGDRALFTSDSFVVAGPCVATMPLPVTQPFLPQPS